MHVLDGVVLGPVHAVALRLPDLGGQGRHLGDLHQDPDILDHEAVADVGLLQGGGEAVHLLRPRPDVHRPPQPDLCPEVIVVSQRRQGLGLDRGLH